MHPGHFEQLRYWNSRRSGRHPASASELSRPWPLSLLRVLYLVEIRIVCLCLLRLLGILLGSISPSATASALFTLREGG